MDKSYGICFKRKHKLTRKTTQVLITIIRVKKCDVDKQNIEYFHSKWHCINFILELSSFNPRLF